MPGKRREPLSRILTVYKDLRCQGREIVSSVKAVRARRSSSEFRSEEGQLLATPRFGLRTPKLPSKCARLVLVLSCTPGNALRLLPGCKGWQGFCSYSCLLEAEDLDRSSCVRIPTLRPVTVRLGSPALSLLSVYPAPSAAHRPSMLLLDS